MQTINVQSTTIKQELNSGNENIMLHGKSVLRMVALSRAQRNLAKDKGGLKSEKPRVRTGRSARIFLLRKRLQPGESVCDAVSATDYKVYTVQTNNYDGTVFIAFRIHQRLRFQVLLCPMRVLLATKKVSNLVHPFEELTNVQLDLFSCLPVWQLLRDTCS
eukprot:4312445-Amphidinium_carterae.1